MMVDTVAAFPVMEPAIELVTCKSVNHPLVTLEPVEAMEPVSVREFVPSAKSPPETVNPPVAVAMVMSAVPSKDTPPMFRAVARAVAVAARPVVEPEEPETLPVTSPTNAVEVIEVAPVMTPASILIVPSNRMAEPTAGSILIAPPESRVRSPAESISTVPSAVICMFAAAAAASVVIILSVPFVPTVNTAVSLGLPVMVITLPLIRTSSIVNVVRVPNEVIFP